MCVFVCVSVCLFERCQGRAGQRRAAGGVGDVLRTRWRSPQRRSSAAAPTAAPRRVGGGLSEAACTPQPPWHSPDERRAMRARRGRRGRRADVRAAVIGSAGEARRSAQAPGCGRSERSETADAVGRVGSSLPSSGALRKPAVGGPIGELVVVVLLSAPSCPRRPALSL